VLVKDRIYYYTSQVRKQPLLLEPNPTGSKNTDAPVKLLLRFQFTSPLKTRIFTASLNYIFSWQDQNKEPRGKFDLVKGCIIGNITEVDTPTKKLKRHGDKVRETRRPLLYYL
jgi:hypothetical protein